MKLLFMCAEPLDQKCSLKKFQWNRLNEQHLGMLRYLGIQVLDSFRKEWLFEHYVIKMSVEHQDSFRPSYFSDYFV